MNYFVYDPDEYETRTWFTPCTCGGNVFSGTCKAPGMCNASSGSSVAQLKPPEQIARIRAEKRRLHEEAILAEADRIRAGRYEG